MDKLPNLDGARQIVFDTETTGVDWLKDRVVGYALAWGPGEEDAVYLPVRHEGGGNLNAERIEAWLRDLLARPDLSVINHALKFDLHMSANHSIRVMGPLECTMVNAALINENAAAFSLDACASRYNIPQKKGDDLYRHLAGRFGGEPIRKAQIGNLWREAGSHPLVQEYARGDAMTTWHLREEQQKQLDSDNLRVVWAVERRVTRTLFRMERNGVRVDQDALLQLSVRLQRMEREARKALPKGFNVRSTPQVADLYRKSGVGAAEVTAKGNPSFTEAWLETNELGQKIILVRKITNLLNSFVNPMLERHITNGRVHTNFNQLKQDEFGTVTGRLSSSGPNLQQVPKRDKRFAPLFRRVFLPEPGHVWSANDYNQQEYRVFAEYLGSKALLDGYNAEPPIDMHTNVARMLGVERDPTAKRMNFGLINGMGVRKLAKSLNVDLDQAQIWWAAYDRMIPEARRYLKSAEFYARSRGWVRTKLHRRRRFPDPRFAHKAGNNIIQGTAADITKLKMVEIDEYLQSKRAESRLLLQVHDELSWSLHPEEKMLDHEARRIMCAFGPNEPVHLTVPMAVDWRHGTNWSEATFGAEA